MRHWHFYHRDTGLLSPMTAFMPDDMARANAPADHLPIEGRFDRLMQRVDVATGQIIEHRDDVALELLAQQERTAAAKDQIDVSESAQHRAVREALLLLLPECQERQRLSEIDRAIKAKRSTVSDRGQAVARIAAASELSSDSAEKK